MKILNKWSALALVFVLIVVALVGFSSIKGDDLTGRAKISSKKTVLNHGDTEKKSAIKGKYKNSISEQGKVPTCEKVRVEDIESDFLVQHDDVLQLMMNEIEETILSESFWDNILANNVDNILIDNVQIVSVSFDDGVPNWIFGSDYPSDVYLSTVNNVFQLTNSFVAFETLRVNNGNNFNVGIDLTLTDGRTFRVFGNPIGQFFLKNYFDVNGTFDFKDSNFNGVMTSVGNGDEMYGDYFGWPNVGDSSMDDNYYFLFGLENLSVTRLQRNGNETEVTDAIILDLMENFADNFVFTVSLDSDMEASDYDNLLRDIRDASGIWHARKILEGSAPYSDKDNLRTEWIEMSGGGIYAFVCDYGQMKTIFDPRLKKPKGEYVKNGVDYNF